MAIEARRAAIYLRISQDRENNRLGVDRHREDAQGMIKARGWSSVGIYEDNDVTGSGRKKRPDFERLLADIGAGLIDVVVAQEWPRLERNRIDGVRIIEAAQRHHVLLTFAKGSDIDCSTAAVECQLTCSPRSPGTRSRSSPNGSPEHSVSAPNKDDHQREYGRLVMRSTGM